MVVSVSSTGGYIDTSLCMSEDQKNHSLIIHDKLQQSHSFQDLFHSDKSAKEQATLVNAQIY